MLAAAILADAPLLSKHLEAIKTNVSSGAINMGGAMLEEEPKDGEPLKVNGSAMLIAADTREEAMQIIENDIYYESGVWDPEKVCWTCPPSQSEHGTSRWRCLKPSWCRWALYAMLLLTVIADSSLPFQNGRTE